MIPPHINMIVYLEMMGHDSTVSRRILYLEDILCSIQGGGGEGEDESWRNLAVGQAAIRSIDSQVRSILANQTTDVPHPSASYARWTCVCMCACVVLCSVIFFTHQPTEYAYIILHVFVCIFFALNVLVD